MCKIIINRIDIVYTGTMTKILNMDNDPIIVAIDVETSGPNFISNGLLSIGVTVQDWDMNELCYFQRNLALEDNLHFDTECLNNFWNLHKEAYDFATSNTIPPRLAMDEFVAFLYEVECKYSNLIIISDNPSFDIGWINLYLSKYTKRYSLNYSTSGIYRMIWDVGSIQKAWYILKYKKSFNSISSGYKNSFNFVSPYKRDHIALNDARNIAAFFSHIWKQIQNEDTFISNKKNPGISCPL